MQGSRVESLVEVREVFGRLRGSIRRAVVGKDRVVDLCLISLLAGGHVLPSDITGTSVYDPREAVCKWLAGPVFAPVLLADEIYRATARTQSALLEAMAEGQVTVEGETRELPEPFFVVATQNPHQFHGTYPLPEGQLDRFMVATTKPQRTGRRLPVHLAWLRHDPDHHQGRAHR